MKIGIAITSHNRPEVAEQTYNLLNKWRPENSVIGIVDDASYRPPFGVWNNHVKVYKFKEHVGVGVAKNKCLELLHDLDCTHFFLFDDDCRPLVNEWWLPYINSGLEHACWNYNRKTIRPNEEYYDESDTFNYNSYEKPNGCMLYFTRKAIDTAGGWDLDFNGYGYEHVNLSDRIYNLELTPDRYVDVKNSENLFELADTESSFTNEQRSQIPTNLHLYQQKYYSKEFKPFK